MRSLCILSFLVLFSIGCKSQPHSPMSTLQPEVAKLAATMEDQGGEHIHMPKLPTGYSSDRYYNVTGAELTPASLKGKVVLIDIWDYTCVNCIRTLPYIKSWAEKYKDKGLVILGVHSPEFDFEKDPNNLGAAVKKFGLTYPVIADNEYEIWQSLANRYWPAKYLFDKSGILRTTHFGEGEYQEFEAFLQKILLERDSTIILPALSELVRTTDKPGSVCYRPTPETYVGFSRNHPGNKEEIAPNKAVNFAPLKSIDEDRLYFEGGWMIRSEFATPTGDKPSSLIINYEAKEVNLVIHPQGGQCTVIVEQNGKPIVKADRGSDVIEENGKTVLKVSEPRMYNIINNSKFGRAVLKLTSDSPSFGAYAYTFTSDCKE
jgi:thiol-disulfide isomerase/thioredoxin